MTTCNQSGQVGVCQLSLQSYRDPASLSDRRLRRQGLLLLLLLLLALAPVFADRSSWSMVLIPSAIVSSARSSWGERWLRLAYTRRAASLQKYSSTCFISATLFVPVAPCTRTAGPIKLFCSGSCCCICRAASQEPSCGSRCPCTEAAVAATVAEAIAVVGRFLRRALAAATSLRRVADFVLGFCSALLFMGAGVAAA